MITIACGDHSPSPQKLAARINELAGGEISRTLPYPLLVDDFVVRWGCYGGDTADGAVVLNRADAIRRSSAKMGARIAMRDNGIPTPQVWPASDQVTFPVIARSEFHQAGSGWWLCHNQTELDQAVRGGAHYAAKVFDHTHEFRVHCAGGRVLGVQDKNIIPHSVTRNFTDRAKWCLIKREDAHLGTVVDSLRVTRLLGLDFAAVDVMFNEDTGEHMVLETNTAPALEGQLITNRYAIYIINQQRERVNRFTQEIRVPSKAAELWVE